VASVAKLKEFMNSTYRTKPGAIALVGSGEYLPQMSETDRFLLGTLGSSAVRVALLPTASGLELGMPERWNTMGAEHFRELGAEVTPVALIGRADAQEQEVIAGLEGADLYYFSGGNPEHLIESLRDTLAWEVIYSGYLQGAVLAGCSAGAMMLGSYTLSVRSVIRGQAPQWVPAMGVLPGIVVMPHFDRIADFAGQAASWRVLGRQMVSVFDGDGARVIYRAGERVPLE
jgi:cyanophycinase